MANYNGDFPAIPTHGGQFIQYNIFGNLFEITSKYRPPITPIGRGAYGIVCSLLNSETNEMVAVKKIANAFDNQMDAKRTLREIKLLRHLDHENVIGIRDVIPPPLRREFTDVYIAMELMDTDLHQIIRSNQGLSEEHCQYFLYQLLRGLKYIHSANIIHRDLKPSNLLLNANCDLKICDFGLARPTSENEFMTEIYNYFLWLRTWSIHHSCFLSLAAPMGKEFNFGYSQSLLGKPTESDLGFVRNEDARRYIQQLDSHPRRSLAELFPLVHPLAIDLVDRMLTFDPTKRITGEFDILIFIIF
ncbi:MITOGEN-ACTIVATED PROTEIN KINASE [Salix viminalis]|uniref:Mitogen-activated protein kinase n=1 Tax=Salix viminalis TaxID=40686 RepID=A0A9Q0NJQ6_SALVM|nr:MITOGEN-ACTIVATED PROTEIN KINASE [Salix viminalis]